MNNNLSKLASLLIACVGILSFTSCDDDDDNTVVAGNITISDSETSKTVDWTENECSISFSATSDWTASVTDVTRAGNTEISWLKLTVNSGKAGDVKMPFLLTVNDSEFSRDAKIVIECVGGDTKTISVHQNQNPDAVHIMSASDIEDYDKYYTPGSWNPHFEKGASAMLRDDAYYSWWRSKQSEHFVVFWSPEFGADPNSSDVPARMRVDIDDLLAKAEQFYATNVNTLKMAVTSQGKSQLDKYKMQIYLIYQDEWLATGSGYDDTIGALWVNPSTCQPVGSTIAHEIGHSFQYQVYADKLLNGEPNEYKAGFRYGFGPDGQGGCGYWEQCAQWQSFQDYPAETFGYHIGVWQKNHHRHFNHEWMRYASYWLQYFWTEKQGIEAYGKIWTESRFPEDPIQTYTRLYCGGNMETFYDEYYDYAARCVTYDFQAVHQYATPSAVNHTITMFKGDEGFQPAYSNCPGTIGFNIIPLNVPESGKVSASLKALAPGSYLAMGDAGNMVNGDDLVVGQTSTYNQQSNTTSSYRVGFVSVKGGVTTYGEMAKGAEAELSYDVPAGTESLYLVVVATPETYNRQWWNDDESDDEQWPYSVTFENTSVKGFIDIDPSAVPHDATITRTIQMNPDAQYEAKPYSLSDTGDLEEICKAFVMGSSEFAGAIIPAGGVTPTEGKIALGLLQPDGTVSYDYSANGIGFWISTDGSAGNWGTGATYWEYSEAEFTFYLGGRFYAEDEDGNYVCGFKAGQPYTVKPVFVYTKNGKQYKAVIELTMQF